MKKTKASDILTERGKIAYAQLLKGPKHNKPLGLRIKREWLQQIVSGKKKIEYRDVTPHYISRFAPERLGHGFNMEIKALRLYVSSVEFAVVELKKITLDQKSKLFNLHLGKVLEDQSDKRLR